MQAVQEDQQHEQGGEEAHPDGGGEEGRAVAGVGEVSSVVQTEALDLGEANTRRQVRRAK